MVIKNQKDPGSKTEIDVRVPDELSYWADHLGVSHVKLKSVVNAVGASVAAVRAHLKQPQSK